MFCTEQVSVPMMPVFNTVWGLTSTETDWLLTQPLAPVAVTESLVVLAGDTVILLVVEPLDHSRVPLLIADRVILSPAQIDASVMVKSVGRVKSAATIVCADCCIRQSYPLPEGYRFRAWLL